MRYLRVLSVLSYLAALSAAAESASQGIETNAQNVARCLASLDASIVAQPKAVRPLPGDADLEAWDARLNFNDVVAHNKGV